MIGILFLKNGLQLKTFIINNLIKPDDGVSSSGKSIDKGKEETRIETEALSLVDSSNILVTK